MRHRRFFLLMLLGVLLAACSNEKIIITAESNDRSMGRVYGGGEYEEGDLVTLRANALENFIFNKWDDDNTDNPRSFIAEDDCKKDYTAFFSKTQFLIIVQSADPTMGSAAGGGTFPNASIATIKAIPNEGYKFSHWSDNDTNATRSITVTGDATYIAYFISEEQATYTITVQSANALHGQTSGSGTFHFGEQVVISATPYPGYTFNRWHDGNTESVRTITVTGNATYIAYFLSNTNPTYTITVTSANLSQGTVSGGGTYNQGDQVTIRAIPKTGFQFSRWNDNNTNAERTFTCNGNASYTAYFETRRCVVSVQSFDNNMGYCTGSGTYNYGQQVTLQAIPYSGYSFSQWQDGNTDTIRSITVTENAVYTAYFHSNTSPTYTITVVSANPNQGTVSGSGTYNHGDQAVISAIPNTGYSFSRWNDNDTNAVRIVMVSGNASYIAYFETRRCVVSVQSSNNSMGYCTGSGTYNYGQQVTIHAIPNNGYSFSHWQDGNTNATRSFNVTDDITMIAYFTAEQYTITVQSNDASQGNVSGGGQYGWGDQVTITATPNYGYAFDHWNDNNTNSTRTITVHGNATYTAYFEPAESLSVTFGSYTWTASSFIGAYYSSVNTFVLGGSYSSSTTHPWFRTQLQDITPGTYYYASYDTIHYFTDSNINLVQYYDTVGIVDNDGYEYGPWQLWNVTVHIISINSAASTISFTITGTMVNLRQLINTSAEQASKRTISVTANNIHYTTSYSKSPKDRMKSPNKLKNNTFFSRKQTHR